MSRGNSLSLSLIVMALLQVTFSSGALALEDDGPSTLPAIKTPPPPPPNPSIAPFTPTGVRSVGSPDSGNGIPPGEMNANQANFYPVPDRWRVGIPGDYVQQTRNDNIFNPYNQNVLKGDYPIIGQDKFLIATLTSDTLFEARKLPSASGISTARSGNDTFFGQGDQNFVQQQFVESLDFFQGDADYRPRDWEFRETGVASYDYLHTSELQQINPDVREGRSRNVNFFGFQELFGEYRIATTSPNFDIMSIRVGIQGFNNDFRGFLFNDNEPGVRLFGNLGSNKTQYNLAAFYMVEKNTDTGLNTFNTRDQQVYLANLYQQDFIWPGYTAEVSFAADQDNGGTHYDDNGVLVRPEPIGSIAQKSVRAYYIGWAGDGHIGRFNVSHQFYQALGNESFNAIAGRRTNIDARFAAVEVSYDQDYVRYRASFTYASGDSKPNDGTASGFDSIFDNPNFFGGGFDLFTRQAIALLNTKVNLTNRNSFLPDLRTSKEEGQANFVNPGLLVYNAGVDYDVTPTLRLVGNVSWLQFDTTRVLSEVEHQNIGSSDIGLDYSLGMIYRPLLNNNVIVVAGVSALTPANGFKTIYSSQTLYSTFLSLTVTY